MIVLLLGTHVWMTIRTKFIQRKIGTAIKLSFSKSGRTAEEDGQGDVSQFGALTTALAATIGTGNIVGVATGLLAGGPGAVFWMWITGVFGMATKYSECYISVKYRVKDHKGEMLGGAMYALERGFVELFGGKGELLGRILGILFALFAAIASFGIGASVQSNSLTGTVTSALGCIIIICMNWQYVGEAIVLIVTCAFSGKAAFGGAVGSGLALALQFGFKRGLFSNESGMGSAPLVAASATTKNPARQALVSMTGTFWDTVIICAITGIMLVSTMLAYPAIQEGIIAGEITAAAELTTTAFAQIPVLGPITLSVGMILFAYSTMLGWAQYGNRAITYLFGKKAIRVYQVIFLAFILWGCVASGSVVWDISDITNALMAVPNCIAVLVLSGVIARGTQHYIYDGNLDEIDETPIPQFDNK